MRVTVATCPLPIYPQSVARRAQHCIFCGDRKATKEHVWSQWISREIIGAGNGLPGFTHTIGRVNETGAREILDEGGAHLINVKPRCACEACNNGWMRKLEEHCRPQLSPMIHGNGIHLPKDARSTIAAWCVLKAMVFEYAFRAADRKIPREAHDWIYKQRSERLAPPEMSVWLGAYRGESQEAGLAWHRHAPASRDGKVFVHTYWISVLVGHLVFQVAGFSPLQNWKIENPHEDGCALMRIWPPDIDTTKKWPPSRILTDKSFHWVTDIPSEFGVTGRLAEPQH